MKQIVLSIFDSRSLIVIEVFFCRRRDIHRSQREQAVLREAQISALPAEALRSTSRRGCFCNLESRAVHKVEPSELFQSIEVSINPVHGTIENENEDEMRKQSIRVPFV